MEITCINCPVGCRLVVEMKDGQVVSVTGNTCKRGEVYARQECVEPMRMVTAVIPVKGSKMPLSVKTRTPIPKKMIFDSMQALKSVDISAPVATGDVVLADVCGSGIDIIATKDIA